MNKLVPYVVLIKVDDGYRQLVESLPATMSFDYDGDEFDFVMEALGGNVSRDEFWVATLHEFVNDFNNSAINEDDYYMGYFVREIE